MTYQLLALDIDGTLIGKDPWIAGPVREAVRAVLARGVFVTLAMGRIFRAALPFAQQGLRDPLTYGFHH